MSPVIYSTGDEAQPVKEDILPEKGEVEEHERGPWRTSVAAISDNEICVRRHIGNHTHEESVKLLTGALGMPEIMARALIEAVIANTTMFVECETIFEEQGRLGGKRHYENYRIR